jgi:hypothetical protein
LTTEIQNSHELPFSQLTVKIEIAQGAPCRIVFIFSENSNYSTR